MSNISRLARAAGFVYLIVIVTGIFAEVGVRSALVKPGDAAATVQNIVDSEFLYRLGIVSDLVMTAAFVMLGYVLYVLLKPAGNNMALLFLIFVAVSSAVLCLNMVNQFAALLLLSGADYLNVFNPAQLNAQVMFFIEMHGAGYDVASIFYGAWLFPAGYLIYKSGFFPKALGTLVMVASVGHLLTFFAVFLLPEQEALTYPGGAAATIGEFALCLWLLFGRAKTDTVQSTIKPLTAAAH